MPKQGVFYQAGHYQILNGKGVGEIALHNCQPAVGKIAPKKPECGLVLLTPMC